MAGPMPTGVRMLQHLAYTTAIGAVTVTPLLGFVVGDKRPSAAASALQMLLAVVLMLATLMATIIVRYRQRGARAAEIRRRALAHGAAGNPVDRFARARRQAHSAGLPWLEADGSVAWPDSVKTFTPDLIFPDYWDEGGIPRCNRCKAHETATAPKRPG